MRTSSKSSTICSGRATPSSVSVLPVGSGLICIAKLVFSRRARYVVSVRKNGRLHQRRASLSVKKSEERFLTPRCFVRNDGALNAARKRYGLFALVGGGAAALAVA